MAQVLSPMQLEELRRVLTHSLRNLD